ncbi:MAG: class I SAM-dependent methyltransferase [Deltaproteobacteria bacterium]|nr:class I SAM-dependent methyltransferase [Deltaproteobacteria bacterium]MBW2388486.1 class I SAM-dependent methyltransferase [Deltaproteobacteria bacterium]MBW2725966.1 class I SAM-dependent methyltransferase [Deltaproteobacteria bacterium]
MDLVTKKKWDRAAANFDVMAGYGPEKRWAPAKNEFFSRMGDGKILFLAVGTGLDVQFFPENRSIVGIDISDRMLEKARARTDGYRGSLELQQMDVHEMPFADGEFDQVFTSCTFCSVPDPIKGLQALRRVLKPGGELHMFEHTGSRYFPFNVMMNVMTPLSRLVGPEMNRRTVENVIAAGFTLDEVVHVYLDVVKIIRAHA